LAIRAVLRAPKILLRRQKKSDGQLVFDHYEA
jgi:hypothetical protein